MKGDLKNIETITKQKESWKKNDNKERFTVWWVTHLDKYIFTPNLTKDEVFYHFGIDNDLFNTKLGALFLGVKFD
jgi:hypothetical protein